RRGTLNQRHSLAIETLYPSSFSPWRIVSIISRPRPAGTATFIALSTPTWLPRTPLTAPYAHAHIAHECHAAWHVRRYPHCSYHLRPSSLFRQGINRKPDWLQQSLSCPE